MSNKQEYARNRTGSNITKIIIDRDLCIGAASCIAVAGAVYKLDDENKAVVTDSNSVDDATLIMSAESCPTKAIFLFDKDGKQVFPK